MPLVEQKTSTLPKHLSPPAVFNEVGGLFSFGHDVVLHRFTDSDYPIQTLLCFNSLYLRA